MADIYFVNPCESIRLSQDRGFFCSGYWDMRDCIANQKSFGEQDIITRLLNECPVELDFSKSMIDIGANVGVYTITIGPKFKQVYAFEPNLYFNYLLHANVALCNMIPNVNISKDLLSDNHNPVSFNGFCGDLGNCEQLYDKPVMIKPKTLDELEFDEIGFIKIDVEGMEERILRGGEQLLIKNNLPPILFEAWDETSSGYLGISGDRLNAHKASIFNYLESIGYQILDKWGQFDTHLAIKK